MGQQKDDFFPQTLALPLPLRLINLMWDIKIEIQIIVEMTNGSSAGTAELNLCVYARQE